MRLQLVESDRWEPRPLRVLPWGHTAFHCFICGEPVFVTATPEGFGGADCGVTVPFHAKCRGLLPQDVEDGALALASRQRAWETRAGLN